MEIVGTASYDELAAHWRRAGLLYRAKDERLAPVEHRLACDHERVMAGAETHAFLRCARSGHGVVRAGVAAFQDAPGRYTIHHAASERSPRLLEGCLVALLDRLSSLEADRLAMFFTEGNPWPDRLVAALRQRASAGWSTEFDYYIRARSARHLEPGPGGDVPGRDLEPGPGGDVLDRAAVAAFARRHRHDEVASGLANARPLRSGAGFVVEVGTADQPNPYEVMVLPARRADRVVGVALVHRSGLLVNLSRLCNRVEIHLGQGMAGEDDGWAGQVVGELVARAELELDPADLALDTLVVGRRPGAVAGTSMPVAGYGQPVKRYTRFHWVDDAAAGLPATRAVVAGLYRSRRPAPVTSPPRYVMEHPGEADRLERKTDDAETRRQLRLVGLEPGWQVLDAGCGSGAVSRVMADIVGPAGRVVGIDASPARIAVARQLGREHPNLDFGVADVGRGVGDGEFDLVWSRFLFEYLDDPGAAMTNLVRAAKPGGKVVVADLDGNCLWHDPMSPAIERGLEMIRHRLEGEWDPYVGRKLHRLFRAQPLVDVAVHISPYNVTCGGLTDDQRVNWEAKLATISERVTPAFGGPSAYQDFAAELLALLERPEVFSYSTLIIVEGVRAETEPDRTRSRAAGERSVSANDPR